MAYEPEINKFVEDDHNKVRVEVWVGQGGIRSPNALIECRAPGGGYPAFRFFLAPAAVRALSELLRDAADALEVPAPSSAAASEPVET